MFFVFSYVLIRKKKTDGISTIKTLVGQVKVSFKENVQIVPGLCLCSHVLLSVKFLNYQYYVW